MSFIHEQVAGAQSGETVAVLGGGVIGLASALNLQAQGFAVTLISRSLPDQPESWREAASFGNACTVAPQGIYPIARPGLLFELPAMLSAKGLSLAIRWQYLPFMMPWLHAFLRAGRRQEIPRLVETLSYLLSEANGAWRSLLTDVGAHDLTRPHGSMYVFLSEKEAEAARARNAERERLGQKLRLITAEEVAELEPHLRRGYHSAVIYDDSWSFDSPLKLAQRMLETFARRGGVVLRDEVKSVSKRDGKLTVGLSREDHRFSKLVIACGAWSRELAAQLGDHVMLETERGYHVLFPEARGLISRPICYPTNGFFMTPLEEGLRAAGTVELGGLRAGATASRTIAIRNKVLEVLPSAGKASEKSWLGFRSSMPDSVPVISKSPRHPEVTYAFGHGHLGITMAAVTAEMVAELVSGTCMRPHLKDLRIERFTTLGWKK